MNKTKTFFHSIKKKSLELLKKRSVRDNLKFLGVLLLVYLVINISINHVPYFKQFNTYTIRTESMEPVLMVGDIVVVKDIDPKDIQEDDIIAFYVDVTNDGVDDVIIHYIDEVIQYDADTLVYKSRPEISNLQDRWTIEETDIIGILAYKVDNVGKMLLFLNSWVGRTVLLIDIIIVWVIVDLLFGKNKKEVNKKKKEIKKTEENTKETTS